MLRLQRALPERYTTATPEELHRRIGAAKAALGPRVLVLGHHYQRDEVMRWADARGDSFALSRIAAENHDAQYVVFCGVHFMAESADILTADHQQVVLPDLNAGCSMADMADLEAVEEAWESLAQVTDVDRVVPVTYMNSSADLKAFVGRHRGSVCTSSNARSVLRWALDPEVDAPPGEPRGEPPGKPLGDPRGERRGERVGDPRGDKVLFFPDQHLGRNTAYQLGWAEKDMRVWNPRLELGGLCERDVKEATFLLWRGHCSVHQRFRPEHLTAFRAEHPHGKIVVHPECAHEVVELADATGSTDFIIRYVEEAPSGSVIGMGTEIHLVKRLADDHPDKTVVSLDPLVCPCSTMFRIDAPHLCWVLESLAEGVVVNRITVDPDTAAWARVALEQMLAIT
jgi:quinolinate synthase